MTPKSTAFAPPLVQKAVLSAIGKDRPGIVSEVTGILYRNRCSIEDSSMTILEGEFSMIMIVALPPQAQTRTFHKAFKALENKLGLTISLTTLKDRPRVGPVLHRGKPYIVSVLGGDRPGIVHRVAKLLARHQLNITDLNTKVIGQEGREKNAYAMVIEVEAPPAFQEKRFQREMEGLGHSLRLHLTFKPIETLGL